MDTDGFGELTKALASGKDRRRVLRGLAMGAAASAVTLFGVGGVDAKRPAEPGNGNGRGNGNGKGRGRGQTRVGVCHRTKEGTYKYLRLPEPAARAHARRHGDAINVDLTSDVTNCGECGNNCVVADACTVASCADSACADAPVVCPDDNNECMTSSCDSETGCANTPVEDGFSCTVVTCQDESPCTGGTCQDGSSCTTGTCQSGVCQA